MNRILMKFLSCCVVVLLLSACYKEEHWGFPGPFEQDTVLPDSLPFPFDVERQAGVWMVKDGEVFHDKVLFRGFTDYYAGGDTISWVKQADGMRLIPHRNPYPVTVADHVGGRENSYRHNWAVAKSFLPVGKGHSFYMYIKATVGTFAGTAAGLVLGSSWENGKEFLMGFDGNSNVAPKFFLDLYERTFSVNPEDGWPTVNEVITPGVPAEFETIIDDNLFYIKVNGVLCFKMQLPEQQEYYFPVAIRPWRNFMTVHDFYYEASSTHRYNQAFYEQESGYNFIQRPALAFGSQGEVLLFAEGRGSYLDAHQRILQNEQAIGDTDIILRRSTDNGNSWEQDIQVVVGEGSSATYANPQVVKSESGTLILQYSKLEYLFNGQEYELDPGAQHIFQVTSSDDGKNWSSPKEITSALKVNDDYVSHAAGHGITLKSPKNKGRIVMPVNVGSNRAAVIYSDDQGVSWLHAGEIKGSNLRNPVVAELNDGRLMMLLGHTNVTPRNRLVSYSEDGGHSWSDAVSYGSGLETGQFGHTFPGALVRNEQGTLFAVTAQNRATDPRSYGMSPVLANSPLYFKSSNQGESFSNSGPLFDKLTYGTYVVPVGQMDALVLPNGKLLVATEGGISTPSEGIVVYIK